MQTKDAERPYKLQFLNERNLEFELSKLIFNPAQMDPFAQATAGKLAQDPN